MNKALDVRGLTTRFETRSGMVTAVNDVSFSVERGRIMGLVGESGSGKTTMGRLILRVLDPTSGSVVYRPGDGTETEVTIKQCHLSWQLRSKIIWLRPCQRSTRTVENSSLRRALTQR